MNTSYIYSATRVNTLTPSLLQEADIARMLEANTADDLKLAIKESYLGSYMEDGAGTFNIETALQNNLQSNKDIVMSIAPKPRDLAIMWLEADIHNLRVFIKAKNAEFDQTETYQQFLPYGLYAVDTFYSHAVADTLYRLEPELHTAYHTGYRLAEEGSFHKLETTLDQTYFACQKRLAEESHNLFLVAFVKLQIDLYNLKTRLRTLKTKTRHDFDRLYVEGGTVNKDALGTYEQTLATLYTFGGEALWREVIQTYEEKNDSLPLELLLERYVAGYVAEAKNDIFSLASLISYILQVRLSGTVLRMLFVGKESGIDNKVLQDNVNIVYGKSR